MNMKITSLSMSSIQLHTFLSHASPG